MRLHTRRRQHVALRELSPSPSNLKLLAFEDGAALHPRCISSHTACHAATPQAQAPLLDAIMGIQLESQRRVALSRKNTQQHPMK
jgi:hypothetical protein